MTMQDTLRDALSFYANAWEQDVDAELTVNGWAGMIGRLEPSTELYADGGERARAALASTPTPSVPEELRELSEKASQGTWGSTVDRFVLCDGWAVASATPVIGEDQSANAVFIAACVNYVRSLIASGSSGKGSGDGTR